jgi:phosphoribosylformylglycinamidine synthase
VYYTLEHAVRGISEACLVFGTPVVSGNVSLYNETAGRPVYPTPVIGMLGILDDASQALRSAFDSPGRSVFLLGAGLEQSPETLAGSEYLEAVHGKVAGLPRVNLEAERRLHQLVLRAHAEGLLASAHDCSDGGLAVALAECAILGDQGFEGSVGHSGRLDAGLFGEGQGRIVVSLKGPAETRLVELAQELGVPATQVGVTVPLGTFAFGPIAASLASLREAYESLI